MYDAIIILGATATGKTSISISLAKALNTEIINADSMYIYKELSIGTAKPTAAEMDGVKHHLIDVARPEEDFNVVDYRNLAKDTINNFKSRGILPIIVGGTGFYIDSLVKDYSYGNAIHNDDIRKQLNTELEKHGKEYIHNKLRALNPEAADRLHINDTVRVIRALEIAMQNQDTSNSLQNSEVPIINNPLFIGLTMDRSVLYSRINQRVDIMIQDGLLEEVQGLLSRNITPDNSQSMKGIGYKEIVDYLTGSISLDEAIEKIKQHTRNYAKRQITWFKRNPDIHWFNPLEDKNIIDNIIKLYNS
ncbi:MAG: tRNA (adenosine(37)-N6)-dimethylallyltransferase MiaA [Clostridiales bacterium]|nr:tRNA (adenosine(37)-N6)-dimethylallyltransferase MiaA [Clostridiales bacterium]